MSILGKWFKKETKERLDKQHDQALVDDGVQKTVVATTQEETTDIKKSSKKTAAKKEVKTKKNALPMSPILLRPHITEKAASEQANGVYTFVVALDTTKNEIIKAIKRTYSVTPDRIRLMNVRGKSVRWGRHSGQRKHWKKAMVYLKKGDSMVIHEGT